MSRKTAEGVNSVDGDEWRSVCSFDGSGASSFAFFAARGLKKASICVRLLILKAQWFAVLRGAEERNMGRRRRTVSPGMLFRRSSRFRII